MCWTGRGYTINLAKPRVTLTLNLIAEHLIVWTNCMRSMCHASFLRAPRLLLHAMSLLHLLGIMRVFLMRLRHPLPNHLVRQQIIALLHHVFVKGVFCVSFFFLFRGICTLLLSQLPAWLDHSVLGISGTQHMMIMRCGACVFAVAICEFAADPNRVLVPRRFLHLMCIIMWCHLATFLAMGLGPCSLLQRTIILSRCVGLAAFLLHLL